MEVLFITLPVLLSVIVFFVLLNWYLNRCKHNWVFVEGGDLTTAGGRKYGIYKSYQCDTCLKMKTVKTI
jgi:hypothetical protein